MIVEELGKPTEMEFPVGEFTLDIWLPQCELDIEIQGPQHYSKKTQKRENKLKSYGIRYFLYIHHMTSVAKAKEMIVEKIRQIKEESESEPRA